MTAIAPRWARGLLTGLALLLAGCATGYQHGQTALSEGRYQEAAARFGDVLAKDPDRVDALVGLGLAQYRLDAFPLAVGSLERAVVVAPGRAEPRLYLALSYLALEDQAAAVGQLDALAGLDMHPRIAAQARRAAGLLRGGATPVAIREFVRKSLEDEADWYREVLEARLAPHAYLGPAWFGRDPAGWSSLGCYPYGVPRP
jgi:tetratricopeptide (TPR) repeat protein